MTTPIFTGPFTGAQPTNNVQSLRSDFQRLGIPLGPAFTGSFLPQIEFPEVPTAPTAPAPPPSGRAAASVDQRLRDARRERSEGLRTAGSGRRRGRSGTVLTTPLLGGFVFPEENLTRVNLLGA